MNGRLPFAFGIVVAALMTVGLLAGRGLDDAAARKRGGCPNGTQAFTHVCIETNARLANGGYQDAVATCAALKRRLPTSAELDAFRLQDGITLNGPELSSDFLAIDSVDSITDDGHYIAAGLGGVQAFRCVA